MPDQGRAGARKVTRRDVARYAGVSDAVVSYVVNDSPNPVAPETRRRVLDAVARLGYQPNRAARALSRGRTDMIGMVVPDSRNPFFAELLYQVDRAARARGRTLLILNSDSRRQQGGTLGFGDQQLDGLIIADTLDAAELAAASALDVPLVLINQFHAAPRFASIGVDYHDGAYRAVEHLISQGHERIGFIGGDPGIDPRERGWADALAAARLPLGPRFHVEFSYEGGHHAGARLAAEDDDTTAVFLASDQLAVGALTAWGEQGVRVPEDLAVVSFDGTELSRYTMPPLSTMAQPLPAMAEEAVQRIIDGAEGGGFTSYPTTLVSRASSAHRRG